MLLTAYLLHVDESPPEVQGFDEIISMVEAPVLLPAYLLHVDEWVELVDGPPTPIDS